MKKFILKTTAFVIPIIVVAFGLEISLRNIPNSYSYKKEYLDKYSEELEILFLGSSHSYHGIDPSIIKRKSFNSSQNGQPLEFDYLTVEKYSSKFNKLKFVVIPISYFSLYYKLNKGDKSAKRSNYIIYSKLFHSFNPADNLELLTQPLSVSIKKIGYYSNPSKPSYYGKTGHLSLPPKEINLVQSGFDRALNQTRKQGDRNHFKYNVQILNSIISLAKEMNFQLILYTLPAYQTYIYNLDPKQLSTTINTAVKLKTQNPEVVSYYNFLEDKSFTKADFYDSDHLNESGAKKLTAKISKLIEKIEDERTTKPKLH